MMPHLCIYPILVYLFSRCFLIFPLFSSSWHFLFFPLSFLPLLVDVLSLLFVFGVVFFGFSSILSTFTSPFLFFGFCVFLSLSVIFIMYSSNMPPHQGTPKQRLFFTDKTKPGFGPCPETQFHGKI